MPKASKYKSGDVLTFANGNVGCVTQFDTVVVVDKSGWMTKSKYPDVYDYAANNPVIKIEREFGHGNQEMVL